jgi:aspartate/methionine/tyrosine aminotransferase
MNPRLGSLHTYPFEKLNKLLAGAVPPANLPPIPLYIGEPQHEPPALVLEALRQGVNRLGSYPLTAGTLELRSSAARWLERRFSLRAGSVDPASMVLPVNGTREALFALVQTVVDPSDMPVVILPNPFYQIYEGGDALLPECHGRIPLRAGPGFDTAGGAGSNAGAVPVQSRQPDRRGPARELSGAIAGSGRAPQLRGRGR